MDFWDLSEGLNENISNIISCVIISFIFEIRSSLGDVSSDGTKMSKHVIGDSSNENLRVSELRGPGNDSVYITLHAFTALKIGWEFVDYL